MEHSSKLAWMVSLFDVIISFIHVAAYSLFVLEGDGPAVVYFKYGLPAFFIAILIKLWAAHLLHQSSKLEMIAIDPYVPYHKVKIWLTVSFIFVITELAIGLWVKNFKIWLPMSGFIAAHMIFLVLISPFAFALQRRIRIAMEEVQKSDIVPTAGQCETDENNNPVEFVRTMVEMFPNLERESEA